MGGASTSALATAARELLRTRFLVSGATLAVLVTRPEPAVVLFVAGALLNALLGKLLKRALAQPRPPRSADAGLTDYGMPSSHAQSLFFFAAFLSRFVGSAPPELSWARGLEAWLGAALWAVVVVYSLSRVARGYHTLAQVAVGGGIGAATGFAWYAALPSLTPAALPGWGRGAAVALMVLFGAVLVERSLQKRAASAAAALVAAKGEAEARTRRRTSATPRHPPSQASHTQTLAM
jgi:dolichyldiphosphatase